MESNFSKVSNQIEGDISRIIDNQLLKLPAI